MSNLAEAVERLRARVEDQPWFPGKTPSDDELLLGFIRRLQKEVDELREYKFNKSWEEDQRGYHRMGL